MSIRTKKVGKSSGLRTIMAQKGACQIYYKENICRYINQKVLSMYIIICRYVKLNRYKPIVNR